MSLPSARRAFLAGAFAVSGACSSGADIPSVEIRRDVKPVKVARARAATTADGRSYPGTVRSPETARIGFRVTGTIERYPIEVGQSVEAGEVIAQMDEDQYRIAVREAEARVAGAETTLAVAERNLARVRRLYESNAATIEQLDAATRERDGARAQLRAAEEGLESARLRLGYTELRAPVDSWVVELLAEEGETVRAGTPVVVLGSRRNFEVRVEVPETAVVDLDVGHEAEVRFPRLEAEAEARVKEVGKAPASNTVLYPVVLRIPAPPPRLRVGMVATVRFAGTPASEDEPVLVPVDAVVGARSGRAHVFVVRTSSSAGGDGGVGLVARRREVGLGRVTPVGVAITRGLDEGDEVIVAGTTQLADGDRVERAAPVARLPSLKPRLDEGAEIEAGSDRGSSAVAAEETASEAP
jgi:RND family efflux transporter MFP subunit